jgi:hypothetical protein
VVCSDDLPRGHAAPCGHDFCPTCLVDYVRSYCTAYTGPIQCCGQSIPADLFEDAISADSHDLWEQFQEKLIEHSTPDPLYCPNSRCSQFLGSSKGRGSRTTCTKCRTEICLGCKERLHPGLECTTVTMTRQDLEFISYSKEQGWQTCSKCHTIVERTEGCPHMICRCREEFCYSCGDPWKGHLCKTV